MAYRKDSGETRLQKDASRNNYAHKKNRSIFKNSQTVQTPPKPRSAINFDWQIPDVDMTIDVPDVNEIDLGDPAEHSGNSGREAQKSAQDRKTYEKTETRNIYEFEYEKRQEKPEESRREVLSFRNIIIIIAANMLVPVVGGFIYYIVLASQGFRQKASQSIVLSAIVSIVRLMYLQTKFFE
ncbi:MAG: hypothetical protein LBQ70_07220 [Prevotellaceae bacterium]|jgi:hypothetical protein|nr:hypothetical protein [Prevotellaceae bacterium]